MALDKTALESLRIERDEGAEVKAWQVLARLDRATDEAEYAVARANAEAARRNLRGIEVRLAEVDVANAQVGLCQQGLADLEIRAPAGQPAITRLARIRRGMTNITLRW
jgi:multidrug resistance efflux pump